MALGMNRSIAVRTMVAVLLLGLLSVDAAQAAPRHKRGAKKKPRVMRMVMPVTAIAAKSAAAPDPEILLLEIYQTLRKGRLEDAQAKADALSAAYPKFALGQMIRGDLLLMHHNPVNTIGPTATPVAAAGAVKDLREEASARISAITERPNPNLLPRSILQLTNDQRFALLVDASRSRMYLYKNTNSRLELVRDYYISQGKLGVHKQKEGDMKTPVGVYQVVTRLATKQLADLYGTGALPLNYPNDWDRINDRTGHGIWLHGTSSATYSRAPKSSNGCVVLTNADMTQLADTVDIGKTPVIISDREEFVTKEKWAVERTKALLLVEHWRQDAESTTPLKMRQRYSKSFKAASGENLDDWLRKTQGPLNGATKAEVGVSDLDAFDYPGQDNLLAVSFVQTVTAGGTRQIVRKRQYWSMEDGQWKIVSESIVEPRKA